jgi:hypothetical protein
MTRLVLAVLAGLAVAIVLAARWGGAMGSGVMAGYLLGAGLAGLASLYTRHTLIHRPGRALHALALGFLVKLATLVVAALALRYLPVVSARADWHGFVVAYAAAVALVLPFGTLDATAMSRRLTSSR